MVSSLIHKNATKRSLIAALIALPLLLQAQAVHKITLDSLQKAARERYPYAQQLALTHQYKEESVKSIDTKWLPQLSVSGKTTLQSEVTAVSLPKNLNLGFTLAPGKKFQYQGEVSVTQLIYDGGIIKTSKEFSRLNSDIQAGDIETAMLQVEDVVNTLFENILITKEQIRILNFQKADLTARRKDISTAVKNGMTLKSVLQDLNAELISLEQKKIGITSRLVDLYSQLSFFTQEKIDTSAVLLWPSFLAKPGNNFTNRPDYLNFKKQLQASGLKLKLLNKEEIPHLAFFANGYYGRPGLNFMNYTDHFSGIAGISLKWNINSFYDDAYERQKVLIHQSMIRNQRTIFEIQMNRQLAQLNINIKKNQELIAKDNDVVRARRAVRKIAAVRLENGAITFTDYLAKLNAESLAMANRTIHKIRLKMCFVKKLTLTNRNKYNLTKAK